METALIEHGAQRITAGNQLRPRQSWPSPSVLADLGLDEEAFIVAGYAKFSRPRSS
jgi:hypothetical protein